MKSDPVKKVKFIVYFSAIVFVAIAVVSRFEKEQTPQWFFVTPFLIALMAVVYDTLKNHQKHIEELSDLYRVIRQLQKRTEALEEQLNIPSRQSV